MIPALLVAAGLLMQAPPKAADFPVTTVFKGLPAPPKFKTPGQRTFRSVIMSWVKKGPNFAGHYTLAQWGCGASCVQMAVVDAQTGYVYEGPFGALPKAAICLDGSAAEPGITFRRDSSLLILKGCPDFKDCGWLYYHWTGTDFKLIRKDPLAQPSHCQP